MKKILFIIIALVFDCILGFGYQDNQLWKTDKNPVYLFAGTYTDNGQSKGIYLFRMDSVSGSLSLLGNVAYTENPSYLVVHPNRRWIYAVNELGTTNNFSGRISAFRINSTSNKLEYINSVSSEGNYPCYISIDNTGKFLMTANYGNGSVALFPLQSDGALKKASFYHQHSGSGIDKIRQEGPHAHMIQSFPGSNLVYATDLGTDKVSVYTLDTLQNKLNLNLEVNVTPGAGPRHFAIHNNCRWFYVANELNGSVEVFDIDKNSGLLKRLQIISSLTKEEKGEAATADIHISPNGRFLYVSNRAGNNNIAIFSINEHNGYLTLIGHQPVFGKTPRNFVIDPSGRFLLVANQNSDNIVTFRIDENTGLLKFTGAEIHLPSPVCLKFL